MFHSPNPDADAEANRYVNAIARGAAFDAVIDRCGEVVTISEIQTAAADAMKIMIDDENIVLPLVGIRRLYGLTAEVEDVVTHPVRFVRRWNTLSKNAD